MSALAPDSDAVAVKRDAQGKAHAKTFKESRHQDNFDSENDVSATHESERRGTRPRRSAATEERAENTSMPRTRWDRARDGRRSRRDVDQGWVWSRRRGEWRYRRRNYDWNWEDRDHFWEDPDEEDILDYWEDTRRPLPCLLFVLPFLLIYEFGVLWASGPAGEPSTIRTGADVWMRQALEAMGLTSPWTLPTILVVGLLLWQLANLRNLHFRKSTLIGMGIESLIWAVALIALSRGVDFAFSTVENAALTLEVSADEATALAETPPETPSETPPNPEEATPPPPVISPALAMILGFVGAGIYEESLFRLALVPILAFGFRLLMARRLMAAFLAILVSAAIFAMAHHVGAQGEAFSWYAFVFRCAAGVGFAALFALRGFGIAVGAHIAYDVMVGWLGWHF